MPRTIEELAEMIARRDNISYEEALKAVHDCATMLEEAFMRGSLIDAEDTLQYELGLEPDYLDLFIF